MTDVPGLRRLTLADLDAPTLKRLVDHGEDLLVERKLQLPNPPRFGAAVASMANTLGGWLLLGVGDDRTVHGWDKPERLDAQSHLAAVLRNEVDPLPPFVSDMRTVDGKEIAVLRVFESADAPHIVRGTGAVYVRSSKGKEPVDDHATLLALAQRGDRAMEAARTRLRETPVVYLALTPPDTPQGQIAVSRPEDLRATVRAAPLTVPPSLGQWPLTRGAAETLQEIVGQLELADDFPGRGSRALEPHGRAIVARRTQPTSMDTQERAVFVADCAGVVAGQVSWGRLGSGGVMLNALLTDHIRPVLESVVAVLRRAEAYGRVALDLWVEVPSGTHIDEQLREPPRIGMHAAGELTIPADNDEVQALAEAWHREIQRSLGIVKYEDGY